MAFISISTITTGALVAVGRVFCTPLIDCLRTSVEVILDPSLLDDDLDKLCKLLNEVEVMQNSADTSAWIKDASELQGRISKLWESGKGGSCGDACSWGRLPREIKNMIARGENIKRQILTPHLMKSRPMEGKVGKKKKGRRKVVSGDVARSAVAEHILLDAEEDMLQYQPLMSKSEAKSMSIPSSLVLGAPDEHISFIREATAEHIQSGVERETLEHISYISIEEAAECSPSNESVLPIREVIIANEHIPDVTTIQDGTTAEGKLEEVMDALNDDDVWCIGVWGPGGVGKSTLVKAASIKLKGDSSFSLVRLIELKGNDGNKEVQEAIAKSLGLNMGEGIEGRIHDTLQKQKFLLILDNVWESIDFQSIRVPVERQKGSKIILTTRSKSVCTKMDAEEIEMEYLTEAEAWRLFAEKAGEVVNDENIKPLAKRVCEECGGWPLALVVVGSAMKEERNIDEWRNAIRNKQEIIPTDSVLNANIYEPLELSYDRLDDTLKSCFLYCSIYPKGYYIEINELVQCWLAENLIDQGLPYAEAYSKGLDLIKKLKESCLLEQAVDGDYWEPQTVKMHDVVRDFAIWIGTQEKSKNKSVVISGHGMYLSPIVKLPAEAKNIQWISFVDNRKIKLPKHKKDYSSVTTLLLRETSYNEKLEVSNEFLKGFRAVKVLNMEQVQLVDASRLQLQELRALILRKCSDIEKLPTTNNLNVGQSSGISSFSAISGFIGASFSKLRILRIWELAGVVFSSNDLGIQLPELECLFVHHCKKTEVFDCGPAEIQSIAPNLRILEVGDSYDLKSLCKYEPDEHWISIETLSVKNCPGLKKLPSMPSIKEIRGSLEWWNNVEWVSEDIKLRMNQCFKPLD